MDAVSVPFRTSSSSQSRRLCCCSMPQAYKRFIQRQMEESEAAKGKRSGPKQFTPEPGFVVRCSASHPSRGTSRTCFINICHHKVVRLTTCKTRWKMRCCRSESCRVVVVGGTGWLYFGVY